MRVLVLGATGPSGMLVIHEFFKVYPDGVLVIYARTPSKLPANITANPSIAVIKGELTDTTTLTSVFSSSKIDAVLSTLGPALGHPSTLPLTKAYRTLVPIMAAHGCKRIIALSTSSAEDERDRFNILSKILVTIVWLIQRNAYHDIITYSKVIVDMSNEYDIDWTLVRVPNLNSKSGQKVVAGYLGDGKTSIFLSRYAIAEFYVREIEGKEWVRKAPALSSTAL